jgi:hypothetical protein
MECCQENNKYLILTIRTAVRIVFEYDFGARQPKKNEIRGGMGRFSRLIVGVLTQRTQWNAKGHDDECGDFRQVPGESAALMVQSGSKNSAAKQLLSREREWCGYFDLWRPKLRTTPASTLLEWTSKTVVFAPLVGDVVWSFRRA